MRRFLRFCSPSIGTSIIVGLSLVALIMGCGGGIDVAPSSEPTATASAAPTATPNLDREIARGKRLAEQNACLGCHTTDGRDQVGPTWLGLYGAVVEIEGGETVKVDEGYLLEAIQSPNARIVTGYRPNIMPVFALSDDETNAIIAYIRSIH